MNFNPRVRHVEQSAIMSADDDVAKPNDRLIQLALEAAEAARYQTLSIADGRSGTGVEYLHVWPGEHYKLLAGLVDVMQPKLVVEVGTDSGLSALVMRERLPAGGRIVTFDVLPWRRCNPVLRESDFEDGALSQVVADLTDPQAFEAHRALVESADLLFVDAAKDGKCEPDLLARLETCSFASPPIIVFDDVRVRNMLGVWRGIDRPKLDLTSFGHWSGTGLVEWR